MEVFIKQANLADVVEIAKLFNQYRMFYQQESNLELAQEFIRERLNNNESVIFYAVNEDGQYLGFTQLYPSFSSVSAQRVWTLNDLYVNETTRDLGLGTKLLNRAKIFAIETKAKGISLATTESNLGAQKLYQALGYQKSSGFFNYFLNVSES